MFWRGDQRGIAIRQGWRHDTAMSKEESLEGKETDSAGRAHASQQVAIALGSNVGDRAGALRAAISALKVFVDVDDVSSFYDTKPLYATDQPIFLNAAIVGSTCLKPLTLLWSLKQLEIELGRVPTFRYGPRVIDLDVLFYGDQILSMPELAIPHPRMAEREFVLRPLADIAPDWIHPQTRLTVLQMLERLPEHSARLIS